MFICQIDERSLNPFCLSNRELGKISATSEGNNGLAVLEGGINRKHKVACRKTTDGTEAESCFVDRSGVVSPLTPA